ncbi:MAG: hypothetical protein H6604_00150 [Flavobacteriales bacterium]|nr:hypothetical protein [Flavobacteriales bacterium]
MNKGLKIGISLLVFILILIAVVESTQKKPINWKETLHYKDKIPFGTHILYKEIETIFPDLEYKYRLDEPMYEFFERYYDTIGIYEESYLPKYEYYSDIFCINSSFEFNSAVTKELNEFVSSGGNVFISSYYLNNTFKDSLQIETQEYSDFYCKTEYETPKFSLTKSSQILEFDKEESAMWFSKLPKNAQILGFFHRQNIKVPYFVKIPKGKGFYYIHLEPKIFTNYYLLKKEQFSFAVLSLNYMKGERFLWYDSIPSKNNETTPLRFILQNKNLRFAWYVLLFALIFYLLFKSKREQKAIPIVEPEENKSVEFAKTISSLYYEKGTPGNMIRKKIDYFLFHLRKKYLLDTTDILNSKFHKTLAEKTPFSEKEIKEFMIKINNTYNKPTNSEDDLIQLNKIIDEFEQKTIKK